MPLRHVVGLLTQPRAEWEQIRQARYSVAQIYRQHVLILGLLPPVAGLIGTTLVGWRVAGSETTYLTFDSALRISVAYYVAILVAVLTIGKLIHWMGETYNAHQPLSQCVALAAFTITPMLLVGIVQIYPLLWLSFIIGLPALAYTVYLLFLGMPVMMEIEPERAFLFSSAVLAVGLVALVGMLAATVVLWGIGLGPRFQI